MIDPLKTALAVVGGAFAAGAAWVTLKSRVEKTREDLNRMGRERVARLEREVIKLEAAHEEMRKHAFEFREQVLNREAFYRERIARLEERSQMSQAEETDR